MLGDGGGAPLTALEKLGQDRMGVARAQAKAAPLDEDPDPHPIIDLRGPCGTLMARLDPIHATVEYKCRLCSKKAGRPVLHVFHLRIGRLVEAGERYGKGAE